MAQNTILAAGTTAATSSDVVVAAGVTVTIGIFTDNAAGIPGNTGVEVYIDTPGLDRNMFGLSGARPVQLVTGPCTLRAIRPVVSVNVGVFTET